MYTYKKITTKEKGIEMKWNHSNRERHMQNTEIFISYKRLIGSDFFVSLLDLLICEYVGE